MVLVAVLSLASAGTVGPEAALGWIGSALAAVLLKGLRRFEEKLPVLKLIDSRQITLDAIIAMLGTILPTAILAVVLMVTFVGDLGAAHMHAVQL